MSDQGWKTWIKGYRSGKDAGNESQGLKPLWTIDIESEDKVLQWHKDVTEATDDRQNERVSTYTRNKDLYCGYHQNPQGRMGERSDPLSGWGTSKFKMPEVVVNHSFELTEQWVAKLSSFSTNVDVLPVNSDEGDRNKARASQRYANYLGELHDFKGLVLSFIRDAKIGGESFIVVDYDPHAGDLSPSQKKANEKGIRVKLKTPDGQDIVGEDGEQLFVDSKQRVGDLCYRLRSIPELLLQPKKRWSEVEWFREVELVDVDELKQRYPGKLAAIAASPNEKDGAGGSISDTNSIFVYTYWHKQIRALDGGRKIVLTDSGVLENIPHPFSGAPLNIIRLTDIDIEGELHGRSFLDNLITLQLVLNKLYSLWYQNISLGSHLYWLIPANARIARDKIRNAASVLTYHGNIKPEIAVFRTVSGDVMSLIDKIEARMLTISRIQSTSRGELPPNVEAGIAIGMLEEQEAQAASPDIKKVNACIEKLYKLSLGIAGDKFDKSDGRTLRILGKEGEFLLETLDTAKLSGPYDIKVKKATALSQSKPLMMQQITQLEAMRPGFFKEEELYDLLDLGDRDKFYDLATAARRLAEYENEQMIEGNEVPEPESGEFHLAHWRSHMMKLQTPSFKADSNEDVRELFQDHIEATEFFLVEGAKRNLKLAALLAEEAYFPAFYHPDFSISQILLALQQGNEVPLTGQSDETELGQLSQLPDQGTGLDPEGLPLEEPPAGEGMEQLPAEPALGGEIPDMM